MSPVSVERARARPPLKWLGGKFMLLDKILPCLEPAVGFDADTSRFLEPFVGAANVALNVRYDRMLLGDANPDLPNFYNVALGDPEAFDAATDALFVPENNTLDRYLELRAEFNSLVSMFDSLPGRLPFAGSVGRVRDDSATRLRRASLFAYLNRHCFNGLCRYNKSGGFNAHFGSYTAPQWSAEQLGHLRERLADAVIVCADWREVIGQAEPGDVIYCDPPYLETFSNYSKGGFSFADHQDLARRVTALAERGVLVVVSNSLEAAPLYPDAEIVHIEATRRVSRTAAGRGKKMEMLAVLRP